MTTPTSTGFNWQDILGHIGDWLGGQGGGGSETPETPPAGGGGANLPGIDGMPHWPTVREMLGDNFHYPWSGVQPPEEEFGGGTGGGGGGSNVVDPRGMSSTGRVGTYVPRAGGDPSEYYAPPERDARARNWTTDLYDQTYLIGVTDQGTPMYAPGAPSREQFAAEHAGDAAMATGVQGGGPPPMSAGLDAIDAYYDHQYDTGQLSRASAGNYSTTPYAINPDGSVSRVTQEFGGAGADFTGITGADGQVTLVRDRPPAGTTQDILSFNASREANDGTGYVVGEDNLGNPIFGGPGGQNSYDAPSGYNGRFSFNETGRHRIASDRDDIDDVVFRGKGQDDEQYAALLDEVAARTGMTAAPVSGESLSGPVGSWATIVPSEATDTSFFPGVDFFEVDPRSGAYIPVTGQLEPGKRYAGRRNDFNYEGVPLTPEMEGAEPGSAFTLVVGSKADLEFDDLDPRFGIGRIVTPDGQVWDSKAELEALGYIPKGSRVTFVRKAEDQVPGAGVGAAVGGFLVGAAGQINDMTPEQRIAYANTDQGRAAWTALNNAGYRFDAQGNVTAPDGSKPSLARDGIQAPPPKAPVGFEGDVKPPAGETPTAPEEEPDAPASPTPTTPKPKPEEPAAPELAPRDSIMWWLGESYPPDSLDFGRDGAAEVRIPASALGSSESDWPRSIRIYYYKTASTGRVTKSYVKEGEVLDPSKEWFMELQASDLDLVQKGYKALQKKQGY